MNINISYCVDHNYFFLLAASMASILTNAKEKENIRFYILDNGLTQEDKSIISSFKNIKDFSLQFKTIEKSKFEDCNIKTRSKFNIYNNISVYGRLFIADIFNSVDKLLYLDTDTIIEKSLYELFSTDLQGKLFGACTDTHNIKQAVRLEVFHGSYFNSGVLLIDCIQWRKCNITNKIRNFLKSYDKELRWPDQDLLNILFSHEHVYLLDKKYNYSADLNEPVDPVIYHFMGFHKFDYKYSYLLKHYIKKYNIDSNLQNSILKYSNKKSTKKKKNIKLAIKKYMKLKIRAFLDLVLEYKQINKFVYRLSKYYFDNYVNYDKDSKEYVNGMLNYIFNDRIIKHGPFNGMLYDIITNKNIFQKLLGSYEKELHHIIQSLIELKPKTIINIGTEDGYYAIGMGLKVQSSKIIIFEEDRNNIALCQKLAKQNNLLDRIKIYKNYNKNIFKYVLNSCDYKSLFLFDSCEGQKFFNKDLFLRFQQSFFIIKIHDTKFYDIYKLLISSFKETHNYIEISAISDYDKAYKYVYNEILQLDISEKLLLLSENNGKYIRWFYIFPKTIS